LHDALASASRRFIGFWPTPRGVAVIERRRRDLSMICETIGRPSVERRVEELTGQQFGVGHGLLKTAEIGGCRCGTLQRVKREMVAA
jgi:hypothetical protein